MIYLIVALILVAVVLLWQASRQQREIGLPAGRVIYTDTSRWSAVEKALYDPESGLTGRPDYLVEDKDTIIPVEVKSSKVSASPYDSHIFQLAAYCLLVHRNMGKRPTHGILHYPNRTFAIDYTNQLENALLELIDEMRSSVRRKEVARSHESARRCNACGYRNICDQRIH
jgi:CRISPR-associated exonuclease Cas4